MKNTNNENNRKNILFIGGLDNTCLAGLGRDLEVGFECGLNPYIINTANIAQNTLKVYHFQTAPTDFIQSQIQAIQESQTSFNAVKIGSLDGLQNILGIQNLLKEINTFTVLDVPIISSSGYTLCREYLAIQNLLFNLSYLVTLNIPEMETFFGSHEKFLSQRNHYLANFLIKGGHYNDTEANAEATDILYFSDKAVPNLVLKNKMYPQSIRGTGCLLASYIACFYAKTQDVVMSVTFAKKAVSDRIKELNIK